MIDSNGLNDACYVPLALPGAGALSIGLAVTFDAGAAYPDPDVLILRRNPQLIRQTPQGGLRVYHPSFAVAGEGRHSILFDRWVPWTDAAKCQVVLRCDTNRESGVFLARPDEREAFTFDDPVAGRLKYINLDFFAKRDEFPAVYVRFGGQRARRYVRVAAELSKGTPVVTASVVNEAEVPKPLVRA